MTFRSQAAIRPHHPESDMFNRTVTAAAAILLAAGLSACGGSSEFKTRALAECEKSPDAANQDCACAVDLLDKELDEKTKKLFLAMSDAGAQSDPSKAQEALKAAGLSEADMMEMITKMMPIMTKVEQQCKKA
jgi:hypothetical protein